MTDTGPIRIEDLEPNARVYALNPMTGLVKLKSIADISIISNKRELVQLRGRGLDLRLHPSHPVLYRTKSIRWPRFVRAGSLSKREYYRFINSWSQPPGRSLETVDITDYLERFQARATTTAHGHTFRAALPEGCEPSYVNSHSGYHFDGPTFKRYQSAIESVAEEVSVREYRNQRTHPYCFGGDDFIEFVGWFIGGQGESPGDEADNP
jgi:DNA polymerase I